MLQKLKAMFYLWDWAKHSKVWSPKNFDKFKTFAKKKALQSRSTLKWDNNN